MNSYKTIYLLFFLSLISLKTLALPPITWELLVNGAKVYCHGSSQERFWLCKGPELSGVIDKKPEDEGLPFLPLLKSGKGIELELVITQWITDTLKQDLENEPIIFSISHYLDLDFSGIETYFKNQFISTLCINTFSKITHINDFNTALISYTNKLKDLAYEQYIYCADEGFFSEFKARKPERRKILGESVPCLGKDSFDNKEQSLYETLLPQSGREPNLREANHFFKILCSKGLPFAHKEDGCFARAHILAFFLSEAGFHTGKIWVAGNIVYPFGPSGTWTYHVAALIHVNDHGNRGIFIIDPTLDNQNLLTISEWLSKINISTLPRTVAYPLPSTSDHFDEIVMAFSSHIPMWPFYYDGKETYIDTIVEAETINKEHLQLLKEQEDASGIK